MDQGVICSTLFARNNTNFSPHAEKPLAYFFGEGVSIEFLQPRDDQNFSERAFWNVHSFDFASRKFARNDGFRKA